MLQVLFLLRWYRALRGSKEQEEEYWTQKWWIEFKKKQISCYKTQYSKCRPICTRGRCTIWNGCIRKFQTGFDNHLKSIHCWCLTVYSINVIGGFPAKLLLLLFCNIILISHPVVAVHNKFNYVCNCAMFYVVTPHTWILNLSIWICMACCNAS